MRIEEEKKEIEWDILRPSSIKNEYKKKKTKKNLNKAVQYKLSFFFFLNKIVKILLIKQY